jgi:hypothetical protein
MHSSDYIMKVSATIVVSSDTAAVVGFQHYPSAVPTWYRDDTPQSH